MADAIVRIQSTTSGDTLIDNSAVTVAGSSVRRERIVIGDDSAAGGLAPVSSSAGLLVNLSNLLVPVVASSTGGAQPVSVAGTISVLAASSGGSQPVSITNSLVSVLVSTSGGALPVTVGNALLVVVASTTGGAIAVGTHAVNQGTSPWVTQAATSGGPQPVIQSATPWTVVASTTGGSQPVSIANALLVVVASTTGGAIAVSTVTSLTSGTVFQGLTPWSVVASTTGGGVIAYQGTSPWVIAGPQDVRQSVTATSSNPTLTVTATQRNIATVVFSASSGAATGIALVFEGTDDNVNWVPVQGARTSDGVIEAAPSGLGNATAPRAWDVPLGGFVSFRVRQTAWASGLGAVAVTLQTLPYEPCPSIPVVNSLTSGTVFQGASPWTVVSSSTGGSNYAIVRTTQPAALADAAVGALIIDSKGRQVVTLTQVRQLVQQKYQQIIATGETIVLAGSSGIYRDLVFLNVSPGTSNAAGALCTVKDSSGGGTQFVLTIPAGNSANPYVTIGPLTTPWKHTTATSTGSSWTVNFNTAGVYNVNAQWAEWTS